MLQALYQDLTNIEAVRSFLKNQLAKKETEQKLLEKKFAKAIAEELFESKPKFLSEKLSKFPFVSHAYMYYKDYEKYMKGNTTIGTELRLRISGGIVNRGKVQVILPNTKEVKGWMSSVNKNTNATGLSIKMTSKFGIGWPEMLPQKEIGAAGLPSKKEYLCIIISFNESV